MSAPSHWANQAVVNLGSISSSSSWHRTALMCFHFLEFGGSLLAGGPPLWMTQDLAQCAIPEQGPKLVGQGAVVVQLLCDEVHLLLEGHIH